ncbi:ArsR/SmtB family transcription factor [Listeria seeligeri]|uniref:ArsR/SmtB family transcription factor n=1 Tax=Listeria seeligeri TaxID=1640 RepID=UPI001623C939|nr:metalloregulator ArsR/SmtB family transcription factor [Listeria seeligeri]MBC1424044.1 helix-turn-helix transcriptional regulator [Listeria seeligeri]MBC1444183.1 helix-turn-helix transcriptional regulator [Listeria seeligeri]MBC1542303.1 helix-turn-helix transcriptional regulator [Listeria seeligeri]MBC1773905.1 helix-turn-helix transcriptional regulator [Listeria seeligeri]MBC1865672.1 helix-turn-helix transcriptional regulator [Listeria seeligeri]
MNYEEIAFFFKAMGDAKRVQIIDILSCGELCACDLLEYFDFTQPTLSHHMKILAQANIVQSRKEGTWHFYSLNQTFIIEIQQQLSGFLKEDEHCVCNKISSK